MRARAALISSDVNKTPLKLMRNAYRPSSAQREKLAKFAPRPGRTELSAKITLKTGLRARRAWFWRALGPSWAAPGRHLAGFWPLLGSSWSLLGASRAALKCSWASLGWSEAPFGFNFAPQHAPGLDFGGFGGVLGWVLEGFGNMFAHALRNLSRGVCAHAR